YDVRAIALERLDVDYGELIDLLGGGACADVLGDAIAPARAAVLAPVAEALSGPGQWLFEGDRDRFPLEVLRTKLAAFLDICRGLAAVHETLGRPHMALAPANVMASLDSGGAGVPRRWTFRTALIDLGSPVRTVPADAARADLGELLGPGPELCLDVPMLPYAA